MRSNSLGSFTKCHSILGGCALPGNEISFGFSCPSLCDGEKHTGNYIAFCMTSQHKSDWEERRDLATDDLGDVSDVLPPRPTLDGVEELLEFELKLLVRFEVDPVVVDPVPHRVQHPASHDKHIHTS